MSKTCCVEGCLVTKEDVSYFPLPIKPVLLRKWRDAIGATTTNMSTYSLVCSRHFTKDDYELIRGKIRLKAKVVPSVFGDQIQSPKSPPQNNIDKTNDKPEETNTQTNETKTVTNKKTKKIKRGRRKKNYEEEEEEKEGSESEKQESGYVDIEVEGGGDVDVPVFGEDILNEACMDEDSQENCTIECVPEAILPQDSGTESEPELHKEDIEDIIANYHIKQDKKLADRLKPQEQENQENGIQESKESDKNEIGKKQDGENEIGKKQERKLSDFECIEVEFEPQESKDKDPVFIEISVDQANADASSQDDCLMLLEDVHVDIDPASLLQGYDGADDDDDDNKADPISLLTSSDEDDVILQEPHVDTVEVSDETDEDDQPLVKLVKNETESKTLHKILWGNLREFYCMVCQFKTTSSSIFQSHKEEHNSTVILMCEICNFTSASKSQFARHKKKHKDEKRYKCHLCEYKAKHKMSLIYHLKSHENVTVNSLNIKKRYQGYFQCQKCKFHTNNKPDILRHMRLCKRKIDTFFNCKECGYRCRRKADLARHQIRKHTEFKDADDGEDDDYVPPAWVAKDVD